MAALREALSMLIDSKATPIPIVESLWRPWRCWPTRPCSTAPASSGGACRRSLAKPCARFGQQSKVGSVEHIRDLVNLQLPGIGLLPLPVAPRQIPYPQAPPTTSWTEAASTGNNWVIPAGLPSTSPGSSRLEPGLLGDPRIIAMHPNDDDRTQFMPRPVAGRRNLRAELLLACRPRRCSPARARASTR
jgi:hypothetical protein